MIKGFVLGLIAATGVFFGVSLLAKSHSPIPATPPADRPLGFWEGDFQGLKVTMHIEADQLHLMVQDGEGKVTVRGDADYAVSKEGLMFGVVTSMAANDGEFAGLTDLPFRLRWRQEGDILTVKNLGLSETDDEVKQWCGRFRRTEARELQEAAVEKCPSGGCRGCKTVPPGPPVFISPAL